MTKRSLIPCVLVFCAGLLPLSAAAAIEFDQNVTPDVIFGSGNANGAFTTDRRNSIELGLRAKLRHNAAGSPENTFNSNGDGTYSFQAIVAPTQAFPTAEWSFEWSVNTDTVNPPTTAVGDLTYELGLDSDPGLGTSFLTFDPISLPYVGQDHAMGDNSTANGGGDVAPDEPTYTAYLASLNVAQNSWKPHWFIPGFDPTVAGTYALYLRAIDGDGIEVARTQIQVLTGGAPAAPGPYLSKELISGNDVDTNDAIDAVVAKKPAAAYDYSFSISYDADGSDTPVLVVDTMPAEWVVGMIQGIAVDVDECGESDEADGAHGLVDVYKNGKGKKCNSSTTLEWMQMENPPSESLSFDGDVTPDVIFGAGNDNGAFTIDTQGDVEVGLRAKLRFDNACSPQNIFNSNGDGTYSFAADNADGCAGWADTTTPVWNFEWSVNTDTDDGSDKLADYTYLIGMDADPTQGTDFFEFDPIIAACADHALGDNATANGGGTNPGCGGYVAALSNYNVAQNSWNYEFFDGLGFAPMDAFNPNIDGVYDIYLAVIDGGTTMAMSRIQVIVGNGSTSNRLDVDLSTRESPGKGHKDSTFAPTSCGPLHINDGAIALEKDEEGNLVLDEFGDPIVVAGPSNALCLAVVDAELLPGGGYDENADHDGDGLASWLEACGGVGSDPCLLDTDGDGIDDGTEVASGCLDPLSTDTDGDGLDDGVEDANQDGVVDPGETDPCNPDTDGDGVNDGNDDCPLEGPPDPLLGELLGADGCIFQSQCSDGLDNDNDGLIDFAGGDASCTDIIDDSEDTFDDTDSDGVGDGFDACPLGGGVSNGSFEEFDHVSGGFSDGAPGWTFSATGGGDWEPHPSQACMNPFIQDIPDGDQVGYSNAPEITQDFGIAIEDGKTYSLSIWVGGRCGLTPDDYAASLTADGTDSGTGASGSTSDGWSELTLTLNGTGGNAGQALGVNLENTSNSAQVNWDHAVLSVDGNSDGCVAVP